MAGEGGVLCLVEGVAAGEGADRLDDGGIDRPEASGCCVVEERSDRLR